MVEKHKPKSIIDLDEALIFTAGDHEMLVSLAEMFLTEGPKQLQAIQARIESDDAEGIRKTAHNLKGSVVIFGAHQAAAAALRVEQAAENSNLSAVPAAWDALNQEMNSLLSEVKKLCSD